MFNGKGDNFNFIHFISLRCELSAERYMEVYSQFISYHYFNACACALYDLLLSACLRSTLNNSGDTR